MTDSEQTEDSVDQEQRGHGRLAELHRWRWYLALVVLPLSALAFGIWAWQGFPMVDLIALTLGVTLLSFGASAVVGLPLAMRYADPPDERALVVLDPREGPDLSVRYFTPEEWQQLEVRWGSLTELPGTAVPAKLALSYRDQDHAAWGTHRAVLDPKDLEEKLWLVEDYYDELEEEAARASKLESLTRVVARRAAEREIRENDRVYDELTLSAGDSISDVFEEMMPTREDVDSLEDEKDVDQDDQEDTTILDREDIEELRDLAPDPQTDHPEADADD